MLLAPVILGLGGLRFKKLPRFDLIRQAALRFRGTCGSCADWDADSLQGLLADIIEIVVAILLPPLGVFLAAGQPICKH